MNLIPFPSKQPFDPFKSEPENQVGEVGKEIKKLKRYPRLYLPVKTFLKKLKQTEDISPFLRSKHMKKLSGNNTGLYEIRIPPEAQGGVFRIYFCFSETEEKTLILLSAELKHEKEPARIEAAYNKMKLYKELVKEGKMS